MKIQNIVQFSIATASSRRAVHWKNENISWGNFLKKISKTKRTDETTAEYHAMKKEQQDQIKDVGGYVCGELKDDLRRVGHVISRQVITLDADFIKGNFWDGVTAFFDNACAVYSTHKHSTDNPRLRLLIPLDRPVSAEEYEAISRKLADQFGMEFFDPTTFQPHRLMYWPSTSKDGEFIFEIQDSPILQADSVLNQYTNWQNPLEWPHHASQKKEIEYKKEKAGNPLEKPGLIGAFCRAYNIHEAIEKFLPDIYTSAGPDRYTYREGSTTGGLVTYDEVFAYSHHSTDKISGQLVNAFDLVRIHLFSHLDETAKQNTPHNRLSSFKAMYELAKKDSHVSSLLIDETLQTAMLDFDDEATEEAPKNKRGASAELFFDKHTGLDVMKLCDVIQENLPTISVNDTLYVYTNGVYSPNSKSKMIEKLINLLLGSRTRVSYRREVMEYLKTECSTDVEQYKPNTNFINVKNGLLEWRTGLLKPHTSDFISFTQIPVTYDETAQCDTIERFIQDIVPADTVSLVYEWLGLCLIPETKYSKAVFLTGSGANGKSVFLELVEHLIGRRNISNVSLQDLEKNRFKLAMLQGKLANIYADLPRTSLEKTDVFKTVVSGDRINAEKKGQDAFDFKPYARLMFSMNEVPRSYDTSDGFMRRLLIIHFPNKFGEGGKKADVNILSKLTLDDQLRGFLCKAIEGLRRLDKRGNFEENESTRAALSEYRILNDPVVEFIQEKCVVSENLKIDTKKLFESYQNHMFESGMKPKGKIRFFREIEAKGFERKRISASTPYEFLGISLQNQDFSDEELLS